MEALGKGPNEQSMRVNRELDLMQLDDGNKQGETTCALTCSNSLLDLGPQLARFRVVTSRFRRPFKRSRSTSKGKTVCCVHSYAAHLDGRIHTASQEARSRKGLLLPMIIRRGLRTEFARYGFRWPRKCILESLGR